MSKRTDAMQIVTANRLGDGVVIYLGVENAGHTWHENIRDASLVNADAVDGLLETAASDVAANRVVDPYAIEVSAEYIPLTQRESVRAAGPTIPFGSSAGGR